MSIRVELGEINRQIFLAGNKKKKHLRIKKSRLLQSPEK